MSLIITHNAGFFSCCSVKLNNIVKYVNANLKLPESIDSSEQFQWYKKDIHQDITYEYFEHYDNIQNININFHVNYNFETDPQFTNYSTIDYNKINLITQKYFSPSAKIINIMNNLEEKYNLVYDNICVLFYRGNDKITETSLSNYDDYLLYANVILRENPNITFLIQSDETEFINFIREKFPHNSFYFNDEIRHINRCNNTVDHLMKDKNYEFSKYYLAITIIMSKCKYVVCGSGNCSIWIMYYRGNNKNVYQFLDHNWFLPNSS